MNLTRKIYLVFAEINVLERVLKTTGRHTNN